MFTGIIECMGEIISMTNPETGFSLTLSCPTSLLSDASLGDSIALNGVCLTITAFTASSATFGISPETLR
jgi:riboflavin synthase